MNAGVVFYGYAFATTNFSLSLACPLFLGNFLMAMSSQIMGQILEIKQDKLMDRTKFRPLPQNQISITNAFLINSLFWFSSNFLLYFNHINLISILTTNLTYFSYIFYIQIKSKTNLNTLFGALLGALPIVIGFLSALPLDQLNLNHFLLFSYLFLWQFVHFYGIYIAYENDYQKTSFKFIKNPKIIFAVISLSILMMSGIVQTLLKDLKKGVNDRLKKVFEISLQTIFVQHVTFFAKMNGYYFCPARYYGS